MPLLVDGEVYEIAHKARNTDPILQIVNVAHFRISPTVPGAITADDATLCTEVKNRWIATVMQELPIDYVLLETTAKRITGATQLFGPPAPGPDQHPAKTTYAPFTAISVTNQTGLDFSIDQLPTQCTVKARLVTTSGLKYFRGSKRFSPVPRIDTEGPENMRMTAAAKLLWKTAVGLYCTSLVLGGNATATPGVWSASHYAWIQPAPKVVALSFADVVQVVIGDWITSQNTRKPPHNP